MPETTENTLSGLVSETRERLNQQVSAQGEQLSRLEQTLQELRDQQKKLEEAIQQQLDTLSRFEPPASAAGAPAATGGASEGAMEKLLGSVRNLITATLPEQVLEVLTEEAEQMGVRGAVFDVRGKAAWGASARGFGESLSNKALRGLIIPLNQSNPFRQVIETGGHVDATPDDLKKNRNILDKFKPASGAPILLLPIRSTGSVSAIFYADPGENPNGLPVDGLKILSEFAGAQLDRLMALSGGISSEAGVTESEAEAEVVEAEPEAEEAPAEAAEPAPAEETAAPEAVAEPEPAAAPEPEAAPPPPPPPAAAGPDLTQLSEEDQKAHKDAKRFAKLLVSEIELYNKTKVADGRKNSDLYARLKTDIERSRMTYNKRFSKTAAKEVDYFHEELVRTLAGNDAALLGSEYPGPTS